MDRSEYPEIKACKVWEHRGAILSLVRQDRTSTNHYCGYVRFPKRFVIEQWCSGLLTYVPAHGGLTYAEPGKDGSMTYGFDCAHWQDESNPNLRNEEWLTKHCEDLTWWLLSVPEHEKSYLLAESNEAKAKAIDDYLAAINADGVPDNTSALLNVLSGQL